MQIDSRNLQIIDYNLVSMANKLGEFIEQEVQRRGWSFRELARRAKLSPPTVMAAVSGENKQKAETLRKLARALSVPAETLFRLTGDLAPADEQQERELKAVFYELDRKRRAAGLRHLYRILNHRLIGAN